MQGDVQGVCMVWYMQCNMVCKGWMVVCMVMTGVVLLWVAGRWWIVWW